MSHLITVFDTETTGIDAKREQVVQLASVVYPSSNPEEALIFESLANPGKPIPIKASQLHGIYDQHVCNAPKSIEVAQQWVQTLRECIEMHPTLQPVLVAHNANFDIRMLRKYIHPNWPGYPVVCTLRIARRMDPKANKHTLTELTKRYGLDQHGLLENAHNALADVWMCSLLLRHYLNEFGRPIEEFVQWASTPTKLYNVPFGKHKGKKFSEVPRKDLVWFLKSDMDEDTRLSAKAALDEDI